MKSFRDVLDLVTVPGRYLPLELFAARKDLSAARLKVVMAFPDLYEVGMSHLGVRILYHLLNEQEGIVCERAYAPWTDLEAILRAKGIPLGSHESGTSLAEFDMIGFSLTYELCYTNVLNMLDLAGIPLLAEERKDGRWPLIIGGGPCASNPEPIAPFFDAFLFGDGEEAILEICATLAEAKARGNTRSRKLEQLAKISGVYVPEFFSPEYDKEGRVTRVRALKPGYERVERRIVADLETAYFPERPLVPLIEPIHDRVMIEIARGCPRGCRFCHAGIIYRPLRERSAEKVKDLARKSLAATGYEECSLLALSAGDYSCLGEVLSSLIREHYEARVSVSLPSLRVQGLTDAMLEAIESVRKTGFTIAPEAGTERLRRVINKTYPEAELLETAKRVFAHGWRNLKLYFMVGLPTETDADLEGILRLGYEVARLKSAAGRPQVTVSLSGFVPKPHTPFQWESQIPLERLYQVQERLRQGFTGKNRRVKWHNPRMTELEGVFSRGDRRLSATLLAAFRRGLRFDGWSEKFDADAWQKAFQETDLSPTFYTTRERKLDEIFPWDHLDARVSRAWLLEERARAYRGEVTPDCREAGCENPCGVCDHDRIKPREAAPSPETGSAPVSWERKPEPEIFFLYRLRYARRDVMRLIGQLEVIRLFNRAVRRAGLPIRYSQGFHPLPRIMFGPPPPVGVSSEAEYVDLELTRRLAAEEVQKRLQDVVPPGIVFLESRELPMRSGSIAAAITGFDYELRLPADSGLAFDRDAAASFMAAESLVIRQRREKGEREVDLRSRVRSLEVGSEGELRMGLRAAEGPGVKPQEVVAWVFGWPDEAVRGLAIVRRAARLKEARPVRYPGSGERARRGRR